MARRIAPVIGALGAAAALLPICVLLLVTAGCGHKDEQLPAGSNYYTGPMASKGGAMPKPGSASGRPQ